MMRAVMEGAGLTFWPVFSLIVFFLFAAGLLAWIYRRGSQGFYQEMAGLALGRTVAETGASEGRDHGRQG